MYKILVPKALKPVAREFLTKKGYELVSPEATDEASLAKAIADVDAVIARTEKYTKTVVNAGKNLKIRKSGEIRISCFLRVGGIGNDGFGKRMLRMIFQSGCFLKKL